MFEIAGKVAVITGGGGVLGGSIARCFVKAGAKVALLDIRKENVDSRVEELKGLGGEALGVVSDVLDLDMLQQACDSIVARWSTVDILINAAGGNLPGATLAPGQNIFDMKLEEYKKVADLNLDGTIFPTMIFGKVMAQKGAGSIINISSMATISAISRVMGYSVAKTGINSFTQWMAMEMAQKFGEKIRVNAIAPGFFIGDQNRAVLINPDGSYTERSQKILARTPMNRFGNINELNGAVQFLCSDAASFITGVILPVDGGFSSYSGI